LIGVDGPDLEYFDGRLSVRLEVDYDGDGVPDNEVFGNPLEGFSHTPIGNDAYASCHQGMVSADYRPLTCPTSGSDPVYTGAWSSFAFTLQTDPPILTANVGSVSLQNDTGISNQDGATADPQLAVLLSGYASSVWQSYEIQFDRNDDDVPDGSVSVNVPPPDGGGDPSGCSAITTSAFPGPSLYTPRGPPVWRDYRSRSPGGHIQWV